MHVRKGDVKVYEAIAWALISEGCGPVFGLMGDANVHLWSYLAQQREISIHYSRHEAAAVSMAAGYFQATGRIGVVTITAGPGLAHLGTSLVAAARQRMGVVLLAGDTDYNGADEHPQAFDQKRFAAASECRFVKLARAVDVARQLRKAFYEARVHKCPVILSLPMDIQLHDVAEWNYTPSTAYLPSRLGAAPDESLDALVRLISQAERPVILAGRGAAESGAKEELIRLAERAGALLAVTLPMRGYFYGEAFDIGVVGGFASAATEELITKADLIIAFGATVGLGTIDGALSASRAKIARIDSAGGQLDIGIAPGLFFQGDARATAAALHGELERRQIRKTGYRSAETTALFNRVLPGPDADATDGLNPYELVRHLSAHLPAKTELTIGNGHFWTFLIQGLIPAPDSTMNFSYGFAAIGSALAVAIGVSLGTPGAPHILVEGDGSLLQYLAEFETAVRTRIQLIVLVWNDGGYGAEFVRLEHDGKDPTTAQWPFLDYVAIARALGGDGVRLEKEADLGGALEQGLRQGGLFVIDARVSRHITNFRYKRIFFGQPNHAPLLRPDVK